MDETPRQSVGVRALGLSQSDPLRGPVALDTLAAIFEVPADADGAGVATIVDGSALLSHVKFGRGPAADGPSAGARVLPPLSRVVGVPRGRTAIVQLSTPTELRPKALGGNVDVGPFRARGYAAAIVGGPQDADAAAASRDRLLADLPDALTRCLTGKSEAEAFFLACLAWLQRRGVLERTHDNAPLMLEAVRAVDAVCGAPPRQVSLSNGTDVWHISRGLPSALVVVQGLDDDIAGAIDPQLADSSTARERNRRYRGTFCAGALTALLRPADVVPAGCTLTILPDETAVLFGREATPRIQ